jgi:hypothetical protein
MYADSYSWSTDGPVRRLRVRTLAVFLLLMALLASLLPYGAASAAQYPPPDEPPPPTTNWSYACTNRTVILTGEGMMDQNPQSTTVPDDAIWSTIQLGGVAFNKQVPESTSFEFASGGRIVLEEPSRLINSDTVPGVSPLVNAYTFETGGLPGLVTATADDPDNTTQALVQYTAIPTTTSYSTVGTTALEFAWGGHDGNGAIGPAEIILDLPATLQAATTIQVQVAVMDKEFQTDRDRRIAIIRAEAGGISTETVLLNPDPNTNQLNLRTLTLQDVPAGTSSVTVQLISPEVPEGESSLNNPNAGDSVYLLGASAAHACADDGGAPDVEPVLECVIPRLNNSYTAYFGYRNNTNETVTIPVGSNNRFRPAPADRGQPTVFQPGRSPLWPNSAFAVRFDGNELTWRLGNAEVSASSSSPRCAGRIFFEKEWQDENGNPAAVLVDDLDELLITAESSMGSATCAYTATSDNLVCSYASTSGTTTDGLLVPFGESYTVTEVNVPGGWETTAGTGSFLFRTSGSYCERDSTDRTRCTHPVVNTQQALPWATDWNGEFYLGGDAAVCLTNPQWLDLSGYVELTPSESQGDLQTVWQITSPANVECPASAPDCTAPQVSNRIIEGESQFSINAWWPGIQAGNSSVRVEYRANVLNENGEPLGDAISVSLFWLPWVCNPFPIVSGIVSQSESTVLGSSEQGIEMTIPKQTLSQPTTLSVIPINTGRNMPAGVVQSFQVNAYDEINNTAVTLDEPEVHIHYDESKLASLNIAEKTLNIYYLTDRGWTKAPTTIDQEANTASATLTDISSLGLIQLVGSRVLYLPLVQR